MSIEWKTTVSGICESCVFGDTRLAMNCPVMRDVFYKHYRNTEDIWLKNCMWHKVKSGIVFEPETSGAKLRVGKLTLSSECSLHTSSTEEGGCEKL